MVSTKNGRSSEKMQATVANMKPVELFTVIPDGDNRQLNNRNLIKWHNSWAIYYTVSMKVEYFLDVKIESMANFQKLQLTTGAFLTEHHY